MCVKNVRFFFEWVETVGESEPLLAVTGLCRLSCFIKQ